MNWSTAPKVLFPLTEYCLICVLILNFQCWASSSQPSRIFMMQLYFSQRFSNGPWFSLLSEQWFCCSQDQKNAPEYCYDLLAVSAVILKLTGSKKRSWILLWPASCLSSDPEAHRINKTHLNTATTCWLSEQWSWSSQDQQNAPEYCYSLLAICIGILKLRGSEKRPWIYSYSLLAVCIGILKLWESEKLYWILL